MTTQEEVKSTLADILVPGVGRSMLKMNLLKDVKIADHKIDITLSSAALSEETQHWLRQKTTQAAMSLKGVESASVTFSESMPKDLNRIDNVIAVMSGKGGVGKSLVTGIAAIALKRKGFEVGILDADITGPSIPKMFGVSERPTGGETGILPVSSRSGIEIMSINLLLPSEDDAVIWRGPLIARAITQFWEEVLWGNLDYLIVDLPPGTADAPLTVMQTLPITGIIIVFTPQDLTAMVVRKAVNMARQMGKPILGVVENMSYLYVPEINKKIELFGKSRGQEMAAAIGAPLLARLPIDPELAKLCDEGKVEDYNADSVAALGKDLAQATKPGPEKG